MSVALVLSCGGNPTEPRPEIDLTPFKKLAREIPCADIRNRLFLIDGKLVFWDRVGHCADAAYGQKLFGNTVDDALCEFYDSIAGPVKICHDDRYRGMFDTLLANLAKPDLGLGPEHKVQPIPF